MIVTIFWIRHGYEAFKTRTIGRKNINYINALVKAPESIPNMFINK